MFIKEGFGYFYIKNLSEKIFIMNVKLKKMEGLKLRKPFRGNEMELIAEPNGGEAIATCNVSLSGYHLS